MKTIGLVGGMTPESTRVYYDLLIRGARQPTGATYHIVTLQVGESHLTSSRQTTFLHNVIM